MNKKTLAFIFALGLSLQGFGTARADPFLDEMVGFEGEMFLAQHKVPALVVAVVRDGEVSVKGFGERAGPGSPPPDGDTLMRIGSITKPFTGLVLAAEGKVQLATPLFAGGLQGEFSYIVFAPTRNAAVFVSINKFDFAAGIEMGDFANDLLATIAAVDLMPVQMTRAVGQMTGSSSGTGFADLFFASLRNCSCC